MRLPTAIRDHRASLRAGDDLELFDSCGATAVGGWVCVSDADHPGDCYMVKVKEAR